jgi:outer membrane protein
MKMRTKTFWFRMFNNHFRANKIEMKILRLSIILLAFTGIVNAQEVLRLDDAINIALKNNYDILVARNSADIDKLNNTWGNAGMLPNVSLNGAENLALNNQFQKLSAGTETHYPSVSANTASANAALSWTLFDGGKMFVTKNKLSEIEALGEFQYKEKVLQTVYSVIAAYFDIVRQKQQLKSINEAINYNQERVKISQTSFNAGLAAKTDLLQATIDLNVYKENAISQKTTIEAAKRYLSQLLVFKLGTDYNTTDSIPLTFNPDKANLLNKLYDTNNSIKIYEKQQLIAGLSAKEYDRGRLPKLNFNAGYYWSQADNTKGTILTNRTYGPQFGGTLTIPIFQGGSNDRLRAQSRILMQSANYDLENIKLQVNTDLQNALTDFENQQQLLHIEKENYDLAKENLEICMQRLRQGQTTSLEVHQAQESYVASSTRFINFQYNLKMAETRIRQLIADL